MFANVRPCVLQEAPPPPASRPQTWDMGFGDVDDDYDPAKPNDYMEYCRERINKKKQEERDRELKIIMEEQEREVGGLVGGVFFSFDICDDDGFVQHPVPRALLL